MHFVYVVNPKLAAFAIGLPNDFTCWQLSKKCSWLPSERLHIVLITSKSREQDIYVTAEWERTLLQIPETLKRRRAARKALIRRKVR